MQKLSNLEKLIKKLSSSGFGISQYDKDTTKNMYR